MCCCAADSESHHPMTVDPSINSVMFCNRSLINVIIIKIYVLCSRNLQINFPSGSIIICYYYFVVAEFKPVKAKGICVERLV